MLRIEVEIAPGKKPLSNVLDYERPEKYIVTDAVYGNSGTPVLTANKSFVLGFTQEADGIYSAVPVIIFDDFTTDKKYVDFPFKVKSSAIKILTSKGDDNLKLVFELMAAIKFDPKEHKRYYISEYQNLEVALPARPEQEKIADCVTSLDEVIASQGRKVEALKAHKRGLMQQLFPREGETRPRLRFPEFRDAPEWSAKGLGELAKIRTGKKDANEGAADGAYPFFTCAEDHIYSHSYSFDAEAILIAGNANVGQAKYYKGKFEAYQRTYILMDFAEVFVPYLYQLLDANLRPALLAQVQTSAMSYIRLPMLEDFQVGMPPSTDEQQRIADCLSSLDTQITAESNQLAALKTHKQGLMQQLFPAPGTA